MILTEVYKKEPTRFTLYGSALPNDLKLQAEEISAGLASRLTAYANSRMHEAGFDCFMDQAQITVSTIDGDCKPADRSYCVRYTNSKGGYVDVVGIFTRKGWPFLDHGFDINHRPD